MSYRAVLDASVLVPISLCDILLNIAEAGLFEPRWTDEILRETRRGVARRLVQRGEDPERFMASIDRRIEDMVRAFRRASVIGWEPLVGRITLPDKDDRHVAAAALRAGAAVVVTQNLRHFPTDALPKGLMAVNADAFMLHLLEQSRTEVHACIQAQARKTGKHGKPSLDVATVLTRLTPEAPQFVARIRQDLDD